MSSAKTPLIVDGVTVLRGAVPPKQLERLRHAADEHVRKDDTAGRFPFHGSMIAFPSWETPFAELIANRALKREFSAHGFADVRWLSGYLISKPPAGKSLWWHQDWWAWNELCSYEPVPPQVFAMCYLTDTSRTNGCLRVLPGTHRARHELHKTLPSAHSDEINNLPDDSFAHMTIPGERDVPVLAGDIVIGDSRVLHATHPNTSDQRRHCITLWYAPNFSSLPDGLRAKLAAMQPHVPSDRVGSLSHRRIAPLLAKYDGVWHGPWPYERRVDVRALDAERSPPFRDQLDVSHLLRAVEVDGVLDASDESIRAG